jgi:hypothetical protein
MNAYNIHNDTNHPKDAHARENPSVISPDSIRPNAEYGYSMVTGEFHGNGTQETQRTRDSGAAEDTQSGY